MQTWLDIEKFSKLVQLDIKTIKQLIERGKLTAKEEDGIIFIEASKSVPALVPKQIEVTVEDDDSPVLAGAEFVEKTIGSIMTLHERVVDAKNETVDALKRENDFLKEALYSLQELYDEDRKIIDGLNTQLKQTQEELEFTRRKYKLMWNKTVESFANK